MIMIIFPKIKIQKLYEILSDEYITSDARYVQEFPGVQMVQWLDSISIMSHTNLKKVILCQPEHV